MTTLLHGSTLVVCSVAPLTLLNENSVMQLVTVD